MPDIKQQKTIEQPYIPQKEEPKRKINPSQLAAFILIVVCVALSSGILIYKATSQQTEQTAQLAMAGAGVPKKAPSAPTPTPVPTPTPKPTPSPLDAEKAGEYPADITRQLLVNGAHADKKVAYLTFDDGPSDNTGTILATLAKYNAKATFFVVGKNVKERSELIKKEYEQGHTVGNHSYSHDYNLLYKSTDAFRDEIEKTASAIGDIIGPENVLKLFRFPGGSKGAVRNPYRTYIAQLGYKYVDWNALNSDADGKPFSAERSLSEIKKYCTGVGDVVVLMHDTNAKKITADTLPDIMEYLVSQGYTFERIVP